MRCSTANIPSDHTDLQRQSRASDHSREVATPFYLFPTLPGRHWLSLRGCDSYKAAETHPKTERRGERRHVSHLRVSSSVRRRRGSFQRPSQHQACRADSRTAIRFRVRLGTLRSNPSHQENAKSSTQGLINLLLFIVSLVLLM